MVRGKLRVTLVSWYEVLVKCPCALRAELAPDPGAAATGAVPQYEKHLPRNSPRSVPGWTLPRRGLVWHLSQSISTLGPLPDELQCGGVFLTQPYILAQLQWQG
jgi:hypothetical protein